MQYVYMIVCLCMYAYVKEVCTRWFRFFKRVFLGGEIMGNFHFLIYSVT